MTTLKIAKETRDRNGRPHSSDPDALVHAYDAERGTFPFHENDTIGGGTAYDVLPHIGWAAPLPPGPRCTTCEKGASAESRA